jgi:hypothetical protein
MTAKLAMFCSAPTYTVREQAAEYFTVDTAVTDY